MTPAEHYFDHRTQRHRIQRLTQKEMLWRYINHISSHHFKMVRYYGFLANRKRETLLAKVCNVLNMKDKLQKPGFASLMKQFPNVDPYQCVLCGNRMVFNSAKAGICVERLLDMRRQQFATERWLRQTAKERSA